MVKRKKEVKDLWLVLLLDGDATAAVFADGDEKMFFSSFSPICYSSDVVLIQIKLNANVYVCKLGKTQEINSIFLWEINGTEEPNIHKMIISSSF